MNANVVLSKLVPGKVNPRRVKPDREAHRRLVASIRSFGLLERLIVRPVAGQRYQVIAGNRRLAALSEVHRDAKGEVKVECQVRTADDSTAEALSLAENFAREAAHPLDEAESFARLAGEDGKDAEAIATQFGVKDHYVRQRMKLATLAGPIKAAYREGGIDTGTAEVFTSVPQERQLAVWKELNGHPRHADHVRNVIAAAWIDASHALFDVATLSPSVVSRDLFNERVIVERSAFLTAQAEALVKERDALIEDGWREVVVGSQADVQDRLWSMAEADVEYDEATTKKLKEIDKRWERLEAKVNDIPDDDDGTKSAELQGQLDAVEAEAERVRSEATPKYAEGTKAKGTAFLLIDAEGRVRREYRVPKVRAGANGNGTNGAEGDGVIVPNAPPTPDDLSDRQLATTFTHQAVAVRAALLKDRLARKRVLVLILHDRVWSEALAIKQDTNGTTVHVDNAEGFDSPALTLLRKRRVDIDPFDKKPPRNDVEAYERLGKLSESKLDDLIELLTVECLTAHMVRRTELVQRLADELKVNVRNVWRPDAAWLGSYQKMQLAGLTAELRGPVNRPGDERKKTELVGLLDKLFADAAGGKLEDRKLAETVNRWLPANLRPESDKGQS
ncbi:MAG TPA: ParB/RepB/Spo0J family partition protein [Bryobacteraceae bacterium]|jgi:ParB family chromosome partitioning protein